MREKKKSMVDNKRVAKISMMLLRDGQNCWTVKIKFEIAN